MQTFSHFKGGHGPMVLHLLAARKQCMFGSDWPCSIKLASSRSPILMIMLMRRCF